MLAIGGKFSGIPLCFVKSGENVIRRRLICSLRVIVKRRILAWATKKFISSNCTLGMLSKRSTQENPSYSIWSYPLIMTMRTSLAACETCTIKRMMRPQTTEATLKIQQLIWTMVYFRSRRNRISFSRLTDWMQRQRLYLGFVIGLI